MSLRGYVPKWKKAPWTRVPGKAPPPRPASRRRLRPASPRRAAELRRYHARVKAWKAGRQCAASGLHRPDGSPVCLAGAHPCEDCHHSRGRSGPLLLDERFWVPLCRVAHDWVRQDTAGARSVGLIAPGPWNTRPKEDQV